MTIKFVILAHATDAGGASVAARLAHDLGENAVCIIQPEMLGLARWSHKVDAHGRASTCVRLPPDTCLSSSDILAVLNRTTCLSVPRFNRATAKNRDYAAAELQAIVLSWLAELGDRVVSPVLGNPWLTPSLSLQRWATVAISHKLPVAQHTLASSTRFAKVGKMTNQMPTSTRNTDSEGCGCSDLRDDDALDDAGGLATVLVAGDFVGGRLANRYGADCAKTARELGLPLLEFNFLVRKGGTFLIDVNPIPSLLEPWAAESVARLLMARVQETQR